MPKIGDIKKLKTSWTKYDAVQVINILANRELDDYLSRRKHIDQPILKSFLGIKNLDDPLPYYWTEIYKYPRQLRLFALVAALFTHYNNIKKFAEKYSKGKMKGVLITEEGKYGTNLRSALVEAGAASKEYRREVKVPYDLSPLFESGEVGIMLKKLLQERLHRVGFDESLLQADSFYKICAGYEFYKAISLSKELFEKWLEGNAINEETIQAEYSFKQLKIFKEINAVKVNQWLNDWDDIDFKAPNRKKPDPFFLMFKIDARLLKRISDVHRRKSDTSRSKDLDIQRAKSENRTEEIRKYIEGGFPWSTIRKEDQGSPENEKLKMPGILPTAIIANIIGPGEMRGINTIDASDLVTFKDENNYVKIVIPEKAFEDQWEPLVKPIEIIDGQHRLWAFDENEPISGNYELPVIAYYNLDRTWQAYLFYTINIKPVKINTSLGYDLYPLLRTQQWLENTKDGLLAYRETRSQEIVETLWSLDISPWKSRINMLGESGGPTISQAAFIRALTNTYFRNTRNTRISGGLFADILKNKNNEVINWNRSQQASFIILLWQEIETSANNCVQEWAISLRDENGSSTPFTSKNSLLARDQGVRGISMFSNDFFYQVANSSEWNFNKFIWDENNDILDDSDKVIKGINLFKSDSKFFHLVQTFSEHLMQFDWRTTSAVFDNEKDKLNQMRFKGGSGYSEIWKDLLQIFAASADKEISKFSNLLTL